MNQVRYVPIVWALLVSAPVLAGEPEALFPCKGVAVQVHPAKDPVAEYGRLIREVAELGADTVLISANAYQEDVDSLTINAKAEGSPTDEQWVELFTIAHESGLRVIFMPKVLLTNPSGGAWRGKIKPPSWKTWFDQYRRAVVPLARLAQQEEVEAFLVGSELVSAEKHTDEWRQTIEEIRGVFDGQLGYSANWDHYRGIQFWGQLDFIGLTTYFNLNEAEKRPPTVDDLETAWGPIRKEILEWRSKIDKPLVFTEVGWCSQEGASTKPWDYYQNENPTTAGLNEQAANYEAFIRAWAGQPGVGGIIWWEWTADEGGPQDVRYTPRNKPAEQVLRQFLNAPAPSGG
jgi:hypothetical protein